MEFDEYGRLKNPGIPSPQPVNNYTQTQNRRNLSTFYLWDQFNDFVIGIGNFFANNSETIMGVMIWIVGAIGAIYAIIALIGIWSNNNFIVATIITILGGGLLYWAFLFVIGVLYWVLSVTMAVLRFIFYNAYTLLLVIGICVGLVWYNNRDSQSSSVQSEPVRSSVVTEVPTTYRCTATVLNVRSEPNTEAPIIGQLHKGSIVVVYNMNAGFAHIKYKNTRGWVSAMYLERY